MRISILLFCFMYSFACTAQVQQHIDTAKLFNPSGKYDDLTTIIETKNAVLVHQDFYGVIMGDSGYQIADKEKLAKFLSDSSSTIQHKKFSIIVDSSISFKEIVSLIDIVKSAKINNYQVFNIQTKDKPPGPAIVEVPKYESKEIDTKDYLIITVRKDSYTIALFSDSLTTTNINEIDKFISVHRSDIKENKILVSNRSDVTYGWFNALKEVFKKNNIFKFSIVTQSIDE